MTSQQFRSLSTRSVLALCAAGLLAGIAGCAADSTSDQPGEVRERRPAPITGSNVPRSSTGPVQSASGVLKP